MSAHTPMPSPSALTDALVSAARRAALFRLGTTGCRRSHDLVRHFGNLLAQFRIVGAHVLAAASARDLQLVFKARALFARERQRAFQRGFLRLEDLGALRESAQLGSMGVVTLAAAGFERADATAKILQFLAERRMRCIALVKRHPDGVALGRDL